jgi:hypothetical protein
MFDIAGVTMNAFFTVVCFWAAMVQFDQGQNKWGWFNLFVSALNFAGILAAIF